MKCTSNQILGFFAVLVHHIYGESIQSPTVIVLGYGGFRWDYVHNTKLVNFRRLINEGVTAKWGMQSSFVTESWPNFISLVTGLYPESHGIVGNSMYDPVLKARVKKSARYANWFTGFEPIWITNEYGTVINQTTSKHTAQRSAVVQWVGSNIPYQGRYPSYYSKRFTKYLPSRSRFHTILQLLRQKKPPNLILCYFKEPKHVGHRHGPHSGRLNRVLQKEDKALGSFLRQLRKMRIYDNVNIVIVSDHGMAKVKDQININHVINRSWYYAAELSGTLGVWPKPGFHGKIYKKLRTLKHAKVYRKSEIPERLHYKNHRRIPPLLAIADVGWQFTRRSTKHQAGGLGYDNSHLVMNGLFIARGPAFKRGYELGTFPNVDVYPLLCHVLQIEPRPNNGSIEVIKKLLRPMSKIRPFTHRPLLLSTSVKTTVVIICALILIALILLPLYVVARGNRRSIGYSMLRQEPVAAAKDYDLHEINENYGTHSYIRKPYL